MIGRDADVDILIQDIGPLTVYDDGVFRGAVGWGVLMEKGRPTRLVDFSGATPSGRFSGAGRSSLSEVALSREMVDTGSAILPYALCRLSIT